MFSNDPNHVSVLIVGGGIVGLSASLFLAHHSIPCMLVERHAGTSIHPRSRSVNARTMELYRSVAIAEAVREAGASLGPSKGMYSGTSLQEIIGPKPRSEKSGKFPLRGLFEKIGPEWGQWGTQDVIEPVLLKVARERGVDARFHTECINISQTEDKVTTTLKDRLNDTTYTITSDYVIAADGANSPVREQLGIKRSGQGALGNFLNILFKCDLTDFVKNREFSICLIDRPETTGFFTAIDNHERWVFHLLYEPDKGQKPDDFPPERCEKLLRAAMGMPDVDIDIKSILPWQASVRIGEKFQISRVFLAGDAAHQMPPYAGQGANSGISDVHNLAWKLAAVLKRQAGSSLLETYETERYPVDVFAAEASGAAADERGLMNLRMNLRNIMGLIRRLHIMSGFGYTYSSRVVAKENTWPLGGITWRAWSMPSMLLDLDGRPGSRVPHTWIEKEGKRVSTLDLVGKGFVLLAGSGGQSWVGAVQRASEKVGGVDVLAFAIGPEGDIIDAKCEFEVAAGISSTGALLVRPDGFIAWRERRMPIDCQQRFEEVMRHLLGAS
ncbi:FAD-binding monooxygenase-like protein [Tricladium varicosporioides]|nr:FAD-binding monooxygenase-like protein [Hymenoscyphus varicosporioides]